MDTLFFFEKTKSRIEKLFPQKICATRSSRQNNFLFTTFTTLCFSPIWTILLRDLARSGSYSIRLFNFSPVAQIVFELQVINFFALWHTFTYTYTRTHARAREHTHTHTHTLARARTPRIFSKPLFWTFRIILSILTSKCRFFSHDHKASSMRKQKYSIKKIR